MQVTKFTAHELQEEIRRLVGVSVTIAVLGGLLKELFDVSGRVTSKTEVSLDDSQLQLLAASAQATISKGSNPPPGRNETPDPAASASDPAEASAPAPTPAPAPAPAPAVAIVSTVRNRTSNDDQWLLWMNPVADRSLAILRGEYPLPRFEKAGDGFRLRDPFEDMLDSLYPNEGSRFVYFSRPAKQDAERAGRPLPHRGDILMATFTNGLGALWLAPQHCKTCEADMAGRVGNRLTHQVLDGSVKLPDSNRSAGRKLKYAYDDRCMICDMILQELLRRDVANQDLPLEERSAVEIQDVVDTVGLIAARLRGRGITTRQVKVCTKAVLREQRPQPINNRRS